MRRAVVTLFIGTAAAAVTAGVAMQMHAHGKAVVPAAAIHDPPTSASDASLPAAADALGDGSGTSGEPTPTF